jgi:hypothetical protein
MSDKQTRVQSIESTIESVVALVSDIGTSAIGKNITSVFVPMQGLDLRNLMRKHGEITIPYASISFSDFNRNRTVVNQFATLRSGITLEKNDDNVYEKFYGLPIDINLNIQYTFDNIEDVLKLIGYWMINPQIKYDLRADTFSMKVKFELSESVSFNDQDLENPGSFFKIQSSIKTTVFIGNIDKVPAIKSVIYSVNPITTSASENVQLNIKKDIIVPAGAEIVSGPPGPQGPSGVSPTFLYTQVLPSNIWTINHNLGFRPDVFILNTGGNEVEASVTHTSENTVIIYFASAMAGTARMT